jgi:glycosyltransferase involved in cell wall biosynthesis
MVAMNKGNPSRKAFCQQMKAFKVFHDKHPDTILYMHTIKSEEGQQSGVNLVEYAKFIDLKINQDVFFPDALTIINGYPDIFLNAVYNASDVFLSVTMGEGFGIPIVEAHAAGCPVIVGDWTSMSELCFSGWKVRPDEAQEQWSMLGAIQYSPNWEAIADRLEMAYTMRGNQDYRNRAREGALQYDIENVIEKYWTPVMAEINERVQDRPVFTVTK